MHPHARAQRALLEALADDRPVAGVSPRDAAPDLPTDRPVLVDPVGLDPDVEVPAAATVIDEVAVDRPFVRFGESGEPNLLLLQVWSPHGQVLGALVAQFDPEGNLTRLHGMAT